MTVKRSGERARFGSSLEVKCLLFFGLALTSVLAVSFVLSYKLTETQLDTQNPLMGRLLAEREFILWHFGAVLRQNNHPATPAAQLDTENYGTGDFIDSMKFQSEALDGVNLPSGDKDDGEGDQPVSRLIRTTGDGVTPETELDDFEKNLVARLEKSVTDSRPTSRTDTDGAYHYYQPLRMESSCLNCHPQEAENSTLSLGSLQGVIQVTVPEPPARRELTRFWSLLLAAAIVTTFLGLVAFYVVIRWIIVRPLRSLRDVSEAISSGDITKRAELHTGDEFETLSVAFNRMLRHLVTTQDKLSETNRTLRQKVDELAKQSLRLFETNKIKSDFMATMSHELRTPLNSILGFSEVLGSIQTLDDKQRRYVGNINKSGQTLLNMINDILDMARLEAGRLEASPVRFRVEAIIDAQIDMARPLVDRKNLNLDCHIEPDLPPLFQDESRIGQILNNLLSNAIKFTPEGGKITVNVKRRMEPTTVTASGSTSSTTTVSIPTDEREGIWERDVSVDVLKGGVAVNTVAAKEAFLEIRVSDTGVGISPGDQQIIFEKFRQAGGNDADGERTMTREHSGSGLGLSIVKELCRLLEGEIFVESRVGFGSVFTVVLPWEFQAPVVSESPILSDIREFSQGHAPRKAAEE